MTYVYPEDNRTIGHFVKAEFSNSWAAHRGQVFKANDLTPFHQEFDEWLAEYTRQQREEAWDEGVVAGFSNGTRGEAAHRDIVNPYRKETP